MLEFQPASESIAGFITSGAGGFILTRGMTADTMIISSTGFQTMRKKVMGWRRAAVKTAGKRKI
jgi:hypothetical protein